MTPSLSSSNLMRTSSTVVIESALEMQMEAMMHIYLKHHFNFKYLRYEIHNGFKIEMIFVYRMYTA